MQKYIQDPWTRWEYIIEIFAWGIALGLSSYILWNVFKVYEKKYHIILLIIFILLFIGTFALKIISWYIPEEENIIRWVASLIWPIIIGGSWWWNEYKD
jgi:hypothetical protein